MKPLEGEVIKEKRPAGRPTQFVYEPWMREKMLEIASKGGGVAKMCKEIGCKSRETFYKMKSESEEMQEVYAECKIESQAFLEELGLAGMTGALPKFNSNLYLFFMTNRYPEDYKKIVAPSGNTTEINIGQINSLQQIDMDKLNAKINDTIKKLGYEKPEEILKQET